MKITSTTSESNKGSKLLSQICEIVADVMGIDGTVAPDQTFKSLGADSIDMATLIITLQDDFPTNAALDEAALVGIQTSREVAEYIQSQIND